MQQKGKLLVTTKNSTAMTVLDWVCGVVLVILGIVYMFNETMSRAMTELPGAFSEALERERCCRSS